MLALRAYSTRTARLVALARIGFSAAAVVVLFFDPNQPSQYNTLGYAILVAYVCWAACVAFYVYRRTWLKPPHEFIVYAVDVAVIAFVMVLTEGDTSPFFVFFTFILVAAMLRWSWRGVAWMAVAVFVVFGFVTLLFDEKIDVLRVVIRCIYLGILATMLGFIAAHQARVRAELARLTGPQLSFSHSDTPIAELLAYAAGVFQAPRALLLWSDPEEPWIYVATHNTGGCKIERTSPDQLQPVNETLAASTFLCSDVAVAKDSILLQRDQTLETWQGEPLTAGFRIRNGIAAVVSAPLPGEGYEGRIFILDPPGLNSDQLLVVQVVAEQISSQFELHSVIRNLQQTSANEERIRLARDLHDGVLQLLAGAGLQLQSMRRLVTGDNTALGKQIDDLQISIASQQRVLRDFIGQLKPVGAGEIERFENLSTSLATIVRILEHQWQVQIRWSVEPAGAQLPAATLAHVRYLVAEAIANARRHGGATCITLSAVAHSTRIELMIVDNGRGLPLEGRWRIRELMALNLGPVMLRERVSAAGGDVTITSDAHGTALSISIPISKVELHNDHPTSVG
jgi:signal transduction histidine kinase